MKYIQTFERDSPIPCAINLYWLHYTKVHSSISHSRCSDAFFLSIRLGASAVYRASCFSEGMNTAKQCDQASLLVHVS